jgi:hypothetical protein
MHMVKPPHHLPPAYVAQDREDPGHYRFTSSAMVVMATVMRTAGVLVEEPVPRWPEWPPKGVRAERLGVVGKSVSSETIDASLAPDEQAIARDAIAASRRVRATRSLVAGKVPSFKFASSDGWIVSPEEAASVAAALRRYGERLTDKDLAALEEQYRQAQARLLGAAVRPGEVVVAGKERLGLSLDQLKTWVREWGAYNELASRCGGYVVQ